jgi:2,3-bisphosphoglycerate-independent phosphoglycerate mutase
VAAGLPPLDVAVTKWASYLPSNMLGFSDCAGLSGAAVTDTALYRGLARALLQDPQTSGRLLAAVDRADVARLEAMGFASIGAIRAGPASVEFV